MSFNECMHPRNPFKKKPDYCELAEKYPSFKQYLIPYSSNKKFRIDFDDPIALRCLSTILLKDKFDLDVNIPLNRLIPSVPQRLNYILWLEDVILKCFESLENAKLIDIGTGATCIFPLLSVKMNKSWSFVATELDDFSLECARQNCEANQLTNQIKVIKGKPDQLLPDLLDDKTEFTALMCNPPFFEIRDEKFSRSSSNTSTQVESIFDGGEECFVTKLIEESFSNKDRIKLFTVMLGRKISLKNLKKKLHFYKDDNLLNFIETEFCQGKTIRWGICWTFDLSLNLNLVDKIKHPKKSKVFKHLIPQNKFIYTYNLNRITDYIIDKLNDIMINEYHISNLTKSKNKVKFVIRTNSNTWSNQRKKRRQMKREMESMKIDEANTTINNQVDIEQTTSNDQLMNEDISLEESNDKSDKKRTIHELESGSESSEIDDIDERLKKFKTENDVEAEEFYLLNCSVTIQKVLDDFYLEITANNKIKDKESVCQLFQFLKNQL